MTVDLLRDELLRVPGVESAVVEGDALTPEGVRVRLAAGVDAAAVGEEVQRILASHGLRSEMARPTTPVTVEAQQQLIERSAIPRRRSDEDLAKVAIVEGPEGITVRAESDTGHTADRAAAAGGERLDHAVVEAVAELAGVESPPVVVAIEDLYIEGAAVVTVVIEAGRRRYVGSSIVEGGRPYAVGKATWVALKG